jgi:hypothetical protein
MDFKRARTFGISSFLMWYLEGRAEEEDAAG